MQSEPVVPDRVPWGARLAYSLGNVCETVLSRSFELFVLFFYTQVRGMSGSIAGVAILAAMIADAVTDPLVGSYSDTLKARWGRRHTLMFASAIPSALFFLALFSPPDGLQGWMLGGWLALTAIGLRVSVTFFHIPWSTQIAELSPEPRERVTLAVLRSIFGAVASFALVAAAFDLFFVPTPDYPNGQENPRAYLPFAAAIGGLLVLTILVSSAGTYRRTRAMEEQQDALYKPMRFSMGALWPAWRDMVLRFRNFRCLFLGSLFLLMAFSMNNSFGLYLGTYFWELPGDEIKKWQFAVILGAALTLVMGKPIVDRLPARLLFAGGIGLTTVFFALPILLGLAGILESGTATVLPVLQITSAMAGFCLGIVMIVSAVIASETADEYEQRSGIKATAMLFGFVFLAMKTASGLGKLLAGVIIDLIRLPSAKEASLITEAQLNGLGGWCVALLLVLGALGVTTFAGYRPTPRRPAAGGHGLRPATAKPVDAA
jgi:Na+/melibiose symporter-like transporter